MVLLPRRVWTVLTSKLNESRNNYRAFQLFWEELSIATDIWRSNGCSNHEDVASFFIRLLFHKSWNNKLMKIDSKPCLSKLLAWTKLDRHNFFKDWRSYNSLGKHNNLLLLIFNSHRTNIHRRWTQQTHHYHQDLMLDTLASSREGQFPSSLGKHVDDHEGWLSFLTKRVANQKVSTKRLRRNSYEIQGNK
jgi:hypothetical protein